MIKIYIELILANKKVLADVPMSIQGAVRAQLLTLLGVLDD